MISLNPTENVDNFINISTVSIDNNLYQLLYEVNQSYYEILLENSSSKSQFRKALEWLIPNSLKFITLAAKSRHMIGIKARTIDRYCKKDIVFGYRKYLIEDIKIRLIPLPNNLTGYLKNRLDEIKKMRNDDDRLSILIKSKSFGTDGIPHWFTENRTISSMNKYLDGNSPVVFHGGLYKAKEITPRIKTFVDEGLKFLEDTKKEIEAERKNLDKVKEEFNDYKKVNTEGSKYLGDALKYYEAGLELVYMQLGLYYRSVMYLYGKYLTDIQKVVDIIYEDINDKDIKSHNYDETYDDIKKFTKDLI